MPRFQISKAYFSSVCYLAPIRTMLWKWKLCYLIKLKDLEKNFLEMRPTVDFNCALDTRKLNVGCVVTCLVICNCIMQTPYIKFFIPNLYNDVKCINNETYMPGFSECLIGFTHGKFFWKGRWKVTVLCLVILATKEQACWT